MLKRLLDAVMERRALGLAEQVAPWLSRTHAAKGAIVDIGSGTGHLAAALERALGRPVIATDVSDLHVTGRPPVLMVDGDQALPFADREFSAALMIFMLHYPADPVAALREAARVSTGPIILIQSLYDGAFGYGWLRVREFCWTWIAFHVSQVVGYVPREARFSMNARRFYTERQLAHDIAAAGLRVRDRRSTPVLPAGALRVAAWELLRDA